MTFASQVPIRRFSLRVYRATSPWTQARDHLELIRILQASSRSGLLGTTAIRVVRTFRRVSTSRECCFLRETHSCEVEAVASGLAHGNKPRDGAL